MVTQAHGLSLPLVTAFVNQHGESTAFSVYGGSVYLYGPKLGVTYSLKLVKLTTDATNIKAYFDSTSGDKTAHIRFYCLEEI